MTQHPVDPQDLTAAPTGWEHDLLAAIDTYSTDDPNYDEVFDEVGARIRGAHEAGKADIAIIAFWKRSAQGAWTGDLLALPDARVRQVTRKAFGSEGDAEKLKALSVLPGFARQEAIPTALLCAYDPVDFAVMDRRAHKALERWGLAVGDHRGKTLRYLVRVRAIRDLLRLAGREVTARDVDKGLFVLGR